MITSSRKFIYDKFSDFYNSPSTVLPSPSLLGQREIGFILLKEQIMLRHKVFACMSDLKLFLGEAIPSDVYHSCAYYENAAAEMGKKGWLGADLVFDIDADHIPTSCNKIHDEWSCKNSECGLSGKGIAPEMCPICGGRKFESKTWPCEVCLKSAKDETVKLIDMLAKDFGLSAKETGSFFSGHRGYHVHVENEAVKTLDSIARKEIVDYVLGIGLTISSGKVKGRSLKRRTSRDFSLHDFGWNKRLKHRLQIFIHNATRDDLKNAGIRGKASGIILENKKLILKRCVEEGRWYSVKDIGGRTWKKLAEYVKNLESAKIDTVVTTDTHRLIRMNGTLHGKTGLKKVEFSPRNLEDFDPFKEAVAFKEGAVKVFVSNAPKFRLGEKVFGPYKRRTIELPTAAAILLICKGRAEVVS